MSHATHCDDCQVDATLLAQHNGRATSMLHIPPCPKQGFIF